MQTKQPSIYRQCAAAIDRLIKAPPRQHRGVFTEIDVATEAASDAWGKDEYAQSMHASNEVCGQRYRNRKLCRYGPVKIGRGKSRVEDYARIAGKIVYADAVQGPKVWKTPNGNFKKMMVEEDHLSRQGRNASANRTDAEPWSDQPLQPRPNKPAASPMKPKLVSEGDLAKMVIGLAERVQSLEEERKLREDFIAEQAKRQQKVGAPVC